MPGFNRRGPQGMGPMSGRGQGRCRMEGGYRGAGRGGRHGRRMGFGDGRCMDPAHADTDAAMTPESPAEELAQLRAHAGELKGALENVLSRIEALEKDKSE